MKGYAELQTEVLEWLNRPDLTSFQLANFVYLFEAKAGRMLRTRRQEAAFNGTIDGSNKIALPADWLAMKTLWVSGHEGAPLLAQSLESVVSKNQSSGVPTMYAIDGVSARFDGSGDVTGVYYQAIPSIETSSTNWLSDAAYDAYLFGMLAEGWDFLMNDAQAAKYASRCDRALADVMATDQRDKYSGPLVARVR